jgi:hypothetical protein
MSDILTGTVKGPGLLPHEYLFITRDNSKTRIGEFVYYETQVGDERRQIVGTINTRKLVRNLPDAFLADPNTPPSSVSSLIGLDGDAVEIYEITVETIGYFSHKLNDFVNPRIPPQPAIRSISRRVRLCPRCSARGGWGFRDPRTSEVC